MEGYQSDFRISAIRGEDNVPLENSLGGYGVTTGTDDNVYELVLDPPLTKEYAVGLPLELKFHEANTDEATLNIDKQGAVPLKKFDGESLIPIVNGDLKTDLIYKLVFDGDCFQVLTGIFLSTGISENSLEVLEVIDQNINSDDVFYVNNKNKYAVVNGNLIVPQNLRLRRVGGAGQLGGTASGGIVLKMPVALDVAGTIAWTTHSSEGNFFFCQLSGFGALSITGEFTSDLDEVAINFPVYVAKTPLEFPATPVFNVPPVP
ncbi:hypothetical protein [Aquimarina latercula]|uniref:hypothetical protein n=1 Tax=Aquimarina latercula TaxID=987 RepID=UPI0004034A32|nr:hypothetical protein [Aquimarina latercula]